MFLFFFVYIFVSDIIISKWLSYIFTHLPQGCFIGTGAILWLEDMNKINLY